jgi:flagellar biosynthetic protein FliQ
MIIGVTVAFFQALTQVQEMTLTFVPKIIAGFLIILMTGSYSGGLLKVFTEQLYARIATGFK